MEAEADKPSYNLRKLREIIARASFTDLRIFLEDLGESYDAVVGESSNTREAALAVVKYFDNRGRIGELVTRVQQEFPSAEWDAVIQTQIAGKAEITLPPAQLSAEAIIERRPGPLRIFLCHASQDKPAVTALYDRLTQASFDPWLDKKKIKFGQDWRLAVKQAIEASDLILVCLSKSSVNKEGYVKQEIEDVLNVADRQPAGTIFVIPLRLEECEVPDRIARWHWADYFDESDQARLFGDLRELAVERGVPVKAGESQHPDLWIIEKPFRLELVRVPAGEFLMGSDKSKDEDARDDELPRHKVTLAEFYIGKYPITNEQYAIYAKAKQFEFSIPKGKEQHPVVNVSWLDALAFCDWLRKQTRQRFHLPTEAEWERAARGTDGRIYPWGNDFDAKKLNSTEGRVGDTTPVGKYSPAGDSLCGTADMAGNVWEWTSSLWK